MFIPPSEMPPASGATPPWPPAPDPDLLLEVDFKWLMAGQGCWIDPDRLHQEPGYAMDCVRTAINSPCDALRRSAQVLQAAWQPQTG